MKRIEKFESIEKAKKFEDQGINRTLYWAYISVKDTGNELLDFNEVIWDEDVDQIIENCRAYGIKEFTISSTFSSLIPTLARFEKLGCRMEGLTEVKSRYTDFRTGEHENIPAIKMSL